MASVIKEKEKKIHQTLIDEIVRPNLFRDNGPGQASIISTYIIIDRAYQTAQRCREDPCCL